jgi:hypothetical protein
VEQSLLPDQAKLCRLPLAVDNSTCFIESYPPFISFLVTVHGVHLWSEMSEGHFMPGREEDGSEEGLTIESQDEPCPSTSPEMNHKWEEFRTPNYVGKGGLDGGKWCTGVNNAGRTCGRLFVAGHADNGKHMSETECQLCRLPLAVEFHTLILNLTHFLSLSW